jgi:hypothetical protein
MKGIKTVAVLTVILLTIAGFFPGRTLAAADLAAQIRECKGTVEVKFGEGEWQPARPGMELNSSALVSTGFGSTALLAFGNSTVLIRSLTCLSLEELLTQEGNERIDLHLRAGRLRAEVTPPSGGTINFTVRDPVTTASVRGTRFDFDAINLTVHQGRVAFTGRDRATVITAAGKLASINRWGQSAAPLSREEQALTQITGGASAASGVSAPSAAGPGPSGSTGPGPAGAVSPVVTGPGGGLVVPGIIGAPGGITVPPPSHGGAEIGTSWD